MARMGQCQDLGEFDGGDLGSEMTMIGKVLVP